jgi:hypothetical protein
VKWIADYCGTSIEMLQKHYGKWMQGDVVQLALLAGEVVSPTPASDRDGVPISGARAGKNGTIRDRDRIQKIAEKR